MAKLLLVSILIAAIAIPMALSRDPSATRGLRRTVIAIATFNAIYLLAVVYLFPRLM